MQQEVLEDLRKMDTATECEVIRESSGIRKRVSKALAKEHRRLEAFVERLPDLPGRIRRTYANNHNFGLVCQRFIDHIRTGHFY